MIERTRFVKLIDAIDGEEANVAIKHIFEISDSKDELIKGNPDRPIISFVGYKPNGCGVLVKGSCGEILAAIAAAESGERRAVRS